MFAGAMAVLMVLSAVDVSGWGVMNGRRRFFYFVIRGK